MPGTTQSKKKSTSKATSTKKRSTAGKAKKGTAAKTARAKKTVQDTRSERAQTVAKKAVAIPVGAALTAYDNAVNAVTELSSTSRQDLRQRFVKRQKQFDKDLAKFEKRGTSARERLESGITDIRTQVETRFKGRGDSVSELLENSREKVSKELKSVIGNGNGNGSSTSGVTKVVDVFSTRLDSGVNIGQRIVASARERVGERVI